MSKPTLYLLPGLLCDNTVWQHQRDNLSDLVDIRIANFRGMDSFDAMAASVLNDAPKEFFIGGHSMGGRVAMQILNTAPERVLKLALLDTAVQPPAAQEKDKRRALMDIAEQQGMHELAVAWGTPMVHPRLHQDAQFMQTLFAMVERYSLAEYQGQIRALLNRPDAAPFLAKAPRQTLVMCGREDVWSTWQAHVEFAKLIPSQPRVQIVEQCGHMITMEQPEIVTAAFRDWLLA